MGRRGESVDCEREESMYRLQVVSVLNRRHKAAPKSMHGNNDFVSVIGAFKADFSTPEDAELFFLLVTFFFDNLQSACWPHCFLCVISHFFLTT